MTAALAAVDGAIAKIRAEQGRRRHASAEIHLAFRKAQEAAFWLAEADRLDAESA